METRTVTNTDLTPEERLRQRLYVESRQDGGNPSEFLEMLASVVEQRVWEKLGISFVDLIEKGYPTGIGSSRAEIETMIRLHHKHEAGNPKLRKRMDAMRETVGRLLREDEPKLGEHRRPRKDERTGKDGGATRSSETRGTGYTYTLRRLKRDRPDLAEKVVSGEMSANAAAVEAGFRKKSITVPLEVEAAARCLVKPEPFGPERARELAKEVLKLVGDAPEESPSPEPPDQGPLKVKIESLEDARTVLKALLAASGVGCGRKRAAWHNKDGRACFADHRTEFPGSFSVGAPEFCLDRGDGSGYHPALQFDLLNALAYGAVGEWVEVQDNPTYAYLNSSPVVHVR